MRRREAYVVVDLLYGDQGKGGVTDFLVRDRGAHTVVRYNGGAQAGHAVETADGRRHVFAQLGAGSFVPGVETLLAREVAIQPWAMIVEAEHLGRSGVPDGLARVRVHEDAPVITPFHRAANRLRELARGEARHGSVGVGVGEAVRDARTLGERDVLRARDLWDARATRDKLARIQERKRAELSELAGDLGQEPEARPLCDAEVVESYAERLAPFTREARLAAEEDVRAIFDRDGAVVLEGAQGVLLDEHRGFHPYTTWSDCTDGNAARLLEACAYDGEVVRLGVVRAYATRHGPGPFVTEDASLAARLPDAHNADHPWQGRFRVGWFDAVAVRYAVACCERVDGLAVTCLDRLAGVAEPRVATAYVIDGERVDALTLGRRGDLAHQAALTERLMRAQPLYETCEGDLGLAIAAAVRAPLRLRSFGASAQDKRWVEPRGGTTRP
ncbi:MAG: adenylosuccinate synthetase [Sandaracinaceae bacterium]|nr:adenylosuccinate synthetase [Sandaracinaceae bacterium]